jgi:hypothetical protein
MRIRSNKLQVVSKEIQKNIYPYTIEVLKPRCTGAFSHGICLGNIYHNIYPMVYLWYMFKRHVPYRKPFVHRCFGGVMVYGYMILRMKIKMNLFCIVLDFSYL